MENTRVPTAIRSSLTDGDLENHTIPVTAKSPEYSLPKQDTTNTLQTPAGLLGGQHAETADTTDVFSETYHLSQPRQTTFRIARDEGSTHRPPFEKGKGVAAFDTITEEYDKHALLTEEFDLAREDPRLVHDIQQVLKLKARREARDLSGQTLRKDRPVAYDIASGSSLSDPSSPNPLTFPPVIHPPAVVDSRAQADVDFSPSTTQAMSAPLHPVPALSFDGKLLDWTSLPPDEEKFEKRWGIPISKRKEKEKVPLPQSGSVAVQQSLYAKKLAKIKARANSLTIRKAAITGDQLRRRYDILYESLRPGSTPLNMASIARWNGGLDALLRTSFEKTEPFTWLKHLDKPGTKPSTRLMWHLNALIIEEYYHFLALQPKPESDDGDYASMLAKNQITESSRRSLNRISLRYPLDPASARKSSLEGQVSFEPRAESLRDSHEGDNRRSVEGYRGLKYWVPNQNDSGRNSINSVLSAASQQIPAVSFPTTGHLHVHADPTRRVHRRPANSDDGFSARGSVSDISEPERRSTRSPQRQPQRLDVDPSHDHEGPTAVNPSITFIVSGDSSTPDGGDLLGSGSPMSSKVKVSEALSDSDPSMPARSKRRSHPHSIDDAHRVLHRRRRVQTFMQSPDRSRLHSQQPRKLESEEDRLYREYERKAQLLDDALTHNHTIRQCLHRVAAGVREYESIRLNLAKSLGVPHKKVPKELLESLGHDPSAVTGATRRFAGWRAVDDTHQRLLQQRETFRRYISASRSDYSPPPQSVLEDPITSLLETLQILDSHQQEIVVNAAQVAEVLARVKVVHATVKKQYNDTLSHTSVQYPELSHIVALEESYRDLYQQVWEFGLDALTFVLDTVTPFWRNYGMIIGKDVQDFLIVPLYRNEFTGESKRYPVERIPQRSFRHWVGLLLFFAIAVVVTSLQARAAVTSILHFRLRGITHNGLRYIILPFFWVSIIIQWAAVFTELAIVATQLGVVFWWILWTVKLVD